VTWSRNGKSLVVASAGQANLTTTGDFDGIVTFTTSIKGLPERIFAPNGPCDHTRRRDHLVPGRRSTSRRTLRAI
jgi:hypothetical protein